MTCIFIVYFGMNHTKYCGGVVINIRHLLRQLKLIKKCDILNEFEKISGKLFLELKKCVVLT